MIELIYEYLSVLFIWLYAIIMSPTHFQVNPHSVFDGTYRTPSSKQERYLKFKGVQGDSNPRQLNSEIKAQQFPPTDQIIELNCAYLSVMCI